MMLRTDSCFFDARPQVLTLEGRFPRNGERCTQHVHSAARLAPRPSQELQDVKAYSIQSIETHVARVAIRAGFFRVRVD